MKSQTLNGEWKYRIGKGEFSTITVPFSKHPVGHFECKKVFDLKQKTDNIFIKFYGITYYAKVYLNDVYLGEMGPYCEYSFNVTDYVKIKDNLLLLEMEDVSPAFGPTAGWENFGGIIRDVELIYYDENYIEDVFFYSTLSDGYSKAEFTVETKLANSSGDVKVELFWDENPIVVLKQSNDKNVFNGVVNDVNLWSPDSPNLYVLKVTLLNGEKELDVYTCKVGFREFICDKHRFLLNGEHLFIKGVCKHEMFGDSGHCPSLEQMRYDLQMIKDTGCNFVRLVHYPHNKKVLEIADEIGLMVSEEPGLWWSDTSDPEVSNGSLEVLRRTILRDRNHPSVVFWLSFNECRFTEQYLVDSAKTCRALDPTRLVSGANCMNEEDTIKYYNLCGFDFYTMHPYEYTFDRARRLTKILNDKPLLFTEWGGYFVYDNPRLLTEYMKEMYNLYLNASDEGALAGASFWEWSELNDYNRGRPACIDGNLAEGLVDKYRKPRINYLYFKEALEKMGKTSDSLYWIDYVNKPLESHKSIELKSDNNIFEKIVGYVNEMEKNSGKMRKRVLKSGPKLKDMNCIANVPLVLQDDTTISFECCIKAEQLKITGMTSLIKGYPLEGTYGEAVAHMIITYEDNTQQKAVFCNGRDVTTVFALNNSSRIDPIAENSKRIAMFGYDKNFEHYVLNQMEIPVDSSKQIKSVSICSENNGYALLIYGIS